jgi:hypothetical protein
MTTNLRLTTNLLSNRTATCLVQEVPEATRLWVALLLQASAWKSTPSPTREGVGLEWAAPTKSRDHQRIGFVWAVSAETVSVAKPDSMPPHVRT